jgi:hypothetical protein
MAKPVARSAAAAAASASQSNRQPQLRGDKTMPTFKDQMRTGSDVAVARCAHHQQKELRQQEDHETTPHFYDDDDNVPMAAATPVAASTIENERHIEQERVRAERVAQRLALQQEKLDLERRQLELERQQQDNPFASCCCSSNTNNNTNASGTRKPIWVQRLAIIVLGSVVLAASVTATVCGTTGLCDGRGGGPSTRSATDAAAILAYINSIVLSNQTLRYDPNSRSTTTTTSASGTVTPGATAEEMAVQWLIRDDYYMTTTTDWTQLRQRYALAALYFSTGGHNSRWSTAESWLDPSVSECDWFGISCGDDNPTGVGGFNVDETVVTIVDLDAEREGECCEGNGLLGTLPIDLFLLTSLRVLDVGANDLTGTIPTEIGFMTSLTKLSLATNKGFTGMLPTEIGRLTMLESGFFHDTQFVGNLTATVCPTFFARGGYLWADCREVACDCCTNCL